MSDTNNGTISLQSLQKELSWVKQDCALIRNAVVLLEKERDSLRQAVRKLKLENTRVKDKVKRLHQEVRKSTVLDFSEEDEEIDYDDIGRDFILVGGYQDPFAIRYEVTIRDEEGIEHRSTERYYWYKQAEFFGDKETMQKIQQAANTPAAQEASKQIGGFDEEKWKEHKLVTWETGQRLKFEQVRWIANLLVETGKTYIAVADQDKTIGTGWRKNREEANKPIFWDGENKGGLFLMRYRKEIGEHHVWAAPYEQQQTQKKFGELKKFVWRRIDPNRVNARVGYPDGARGIRGARREGRGRGGHPFSG